MKKYNCPFCKERCYRNDLAKHIEKKHDDEVPENYTAYRLAYDIVNDKPGHGFCVVCHKPTTWNERTQKYNRLCDNPECTKKYKEYYKKNMLRVYNKTTLLDDPKHQEKMLAHRRISGTYIWSDNTKFTYTGQYEKHLMEFLDKTLNFKSNEIVAPGPILEYEFRGKKLHWITDFLIIPYNLIIEVKDGGKNPNRRPMEVYRAKQVAKEEMITNMGKYSYIRLTDNDFGQLLCILAELKMNVVENKSDPIYRIHESTILSDPSDYEEDNSLIPLGIVDKFKQELTDIMNNPDDTLTNVVSTKMTDYLYNQSSDRGFNTIHIIAEIYPKSNRIDKHSGELFKKIVERIFNKLNPDFLNDYMFKSFFLDTQRPTDGWLVGISHK